METKSVFLAGVGGQGVILAARIIAEVAQLANLDVTTSEIHGMAQRGGSVTAQVRFGEKVITPLILEGTATALLAMEKGESLRYVHYLQNGGLAVVSNQEIIPVTVSSGQGQYPENLDLKVREHFKHLIFCDPVKIAQDLGNERMVNVVLLGALSNALDFADELWHQAITKTVKPQFVEMNLNAFTAGKELGENR